jgi:hypothetical protein
MSRNFLTHIDLKGNQLYNALIGNATSSSGLSTSDGSIYFDTTLDKLQVRENGAWVGYMLSSTTLNNIPTATGNIAVGGYKITGLGTPTSDTDAATKAYVDNAVVGIDWKASVRAATTATGNLTTAYVNGAIIDGVTLATGNRILIKNQSTGSENGIYVVASSGPPNRATDADTGTELTASFAVFVEEGSANADSGWVLTNDGTITVGGTALVFTQFTGLGQINAGTGLTQSGNTLNVVGTADRITANANSIDIASTYVGQSSITTLGTVGTGTWAGSLIAGQYGGTGVANTGKTITVSGNTTIGSSTHTVAFTTSGNTSVTLPTSGTLLTTAGSGSSLTFGTGTLSLAGNVTHSGSFTQTFIATGNTSVTLPTSGTLMTTSGNTTGSAATLTTTRAIWGQNFNGSADVTGALSNVTTITGTTTLSLAANTTAGTTGSALTIAGGNTTNTGTAFGGSVTITGGNQTAGTDVDAVGGVVTIAGGSSTLGSGGSVTIRGGQSTSGNNGPVVIGATNTSSVTVGASGIPVKLPGVGTSGFVKLGSGGELSADTTVYATKAAGTIALTANSAGTITHNLGTRAVVVQMYESSSSLPTNLVEMDVTSATTNTVTVTASATATYYYVVIG